MGSLTSGVTGKGLTEKEHFQLDFKGWVGVRQVRKEVERHFRQRELYDQAGRRQSAMIWK